MTDSTDINRDALIKTINLARPALAKHDYIPALTHLMFAEGFVSAYNGNQALQIAHDTRALNMNLCLPGDQLAMVLSTFNAQKVMLQTGEDDTVTVVSGRGRVKIKALPAATFPLTMPKASAGDRVVLTDDLLEGFRRCLMAVGNNPRNPASMGVTLSDSADGKAILYSTDGATISRYASSAKISLPGDAPQVVPTFFCEQMVALAKAFPKADAALFLFPGALMAVFSEDDVVKARVFSSVLEDLASLDFETIVAKHVKLAGLSDKVETIPTGFDSAMARAALAMATKTDKTTRMTPTNAGVKLLSVGDTSEAEDSITMESPPDGEPFYIDPMLVLRAIKECSHFYMGNRAMTFAGDDKCRFIHLIAHCEAAGA